MKKDYIKPCIFVDTFELKTLILDMSWGGTGGPGESEARDRYPYGSTDKRGQRGYGSNGSSGTGWGSLW